MADSKRLKEVLDNVNLTAKSIAQLLGDARDKEKTTELNPMDVLFKLAEDTQATLNFCLEEINRLF